MLLGLLSDTHLAAPDGRLEALLSGPLGRAEVLLHAGDYAAEAVLDHLEYVDPRPFYGVAGNMDAPGVTRRLPQTRLLDLGGRRVGLIHGWGAPGGIEDRVLAGFPHPPEVLVFGHTHRASRAERPGTVLVNPGSPFDRRWAPRRTVALVDIGPEGLRVWFEEVAE